MTETTILFLASTLIGVISFLIIRSLNQIDDRMAKHDIVLDKHESAIQVLLVETTELRTISNQQLTRISSDIEHIKSKLEETDRRTKDFYEKYDLPLKK